MSIGPPLDPREKRRIFISYAEASRDVAFALRDALGGETVEELQALRREARENADVLAARLEADPELQSWVKRHPEIFSALVQAVIALLVVAATRALPPDHPPDAPVPVTVVVEPPSDEDIARVVEDLLQQREAPPPADTTEDHEVTPADHEC